MDYSDYINSDPTQIPEPTIPEPEPTPEPTPAPTPLIVPQNPAEILNPLGPTVPVTIQQNRYYSFTYPSPILYSVPPVETTLPTNTNSSNPYVILSIPEYY
jgi:hypothetical protein